MENLIYKQLNNIIQKDIQYIFLCIGTEKIIGDLYGPLVGQKLYETIYQKKQQKLKVIGRIGKNVTYSNIKEKIKDINEIYSNPYIVAIDSAISDEKNIGKIIISKEKIKIGSAIGKKEYEVGNLSIKGIVGKNQYNFLNNYKELNSISYSLIESMANKTVKQILKLEV